MDPRIVKMAEQLATFPWGSADEPIVGYELVDTVAFLIDDFLTAVKEAGVVLPDTWKTKDAETCEECGAGIDDGEGWDGRCGSCADIAAANADAEPLAPPTIAYLRSGSVHWDTLPNDKRVWLHAYGTKDGRRYATFSVYEDGEPTQWEYTENLIVPTQLSFGF